MFTFYTTVCESFHTQSGFQNELFLGFCPELATDSRPISSWISDGHWTFFSSQIDFKQKTNWRQFCFPGRLWVCDDSYQLLIELISCHYLSTMGKMRQFVDTLNLPGTSVFRACLLPTNFQLGGIHPKSSERCWSCGISFRLKSFHNCSLLLNCKPKTR